MKSDKKDAIKRIRPIQSKTNWPLIIGISAGVIVLTAIIVLVVFCMMPKFSENKKTPKGKEIETQGEKNDASLNENDMENKEDIPDQKQQGETEASQNEENQTEESTGDTAVQKNDAKEGNPPNEAQATEIPSVAEETEISQTTETTGEAETFQSSGGEEIQKTEESTENNGTTDN